MTRRTWTIVIALAVVSAGCSTQAAPRDDKATVRSDIEAFGHALVRTGYLTSTPDVHIGQCGDGHWAAVKWSAPVIAQLARENPDSAEEIVLAKAGEGIKLDEIRFIQRANDDDPAQIAETSDHATVLTITVPKAEYVRVDGFASCQ
jgi:hypothetical protein